MFAEKYLSWQHDVLQRESLAYLEQWSSIDLVSSVVFWWTSWDNKKRSDRKALAQIIQVVY